MSRLGENNIAGKIATRDDARRRVTGWKMTGSKVVFTNGVFDILHAGHLRSLLQASGFGKYLVVGLNSDASVKRLKGEMRPVINQEHRALLLSALTCVDMVVIFDEDTPLQLIETLMPDVLVKSADYTPENIAGAREVIANGGEVKITPLVEGLSTTNIIEKIKKAY